MENKHVDDEGLICGPGCPGACCVDQAVWGPWRLSGWEGTNAGEVKMKLGSV